MGKENNYIFLLRLIKDTQDHFYLKLIMLDDLPAYIEVTAIINWNYEGLNLF